MLATPFPYALIDPSLHVYVDANDGYAALLGITREQIKDLSLFTLYSEEVGKMIVTMNDSYVRGALHKSQGVGKLRRPDGVVIEVKGWARRIEGLSDGPLLVASAVETSSPLEPDDRPWLRRAPQVFGLSDSSEDAAGRADQLEEHLRRIALEVQAAALHPSVDGSTTPIVLNPELDELSSRQKEIVARLMTGDRVTEIARDMYLSPSTVRNHLSVVFRRFGVHSQVELISLLRSTAKR